MTKKLKKRALSIAYVRPREVKPVDPVDQLTADALALAGVVEKLALSLPESYVGAFRPYRRTFMAIVDKVEALQRATERLNSKRKALEGQK